ncbi:MAG: dihydrodipicolinate synthase family protein [Betaproteobacteria bacterium]|nr:dihydrodipicolinate synthase family protein [Betaproteobacteria bacterium]
MISKKDAKDWARERMKGLWTSPMFPFTPDYRLDEAGIRHNVERMLQVKAAGLGFGFSEPWVCTLEERKRAMEIAVDAVRGRVPAYVHATDHSVAETIGLIRHAEAIGADAVMVWAPYEWAKSQEMVCEFYEYVASQVDIAIFLYNTYHSGICMTPETIARLAKIPNVCAVKDAVNDVRHTVRCGELCGDRIVVSLSNEEHLLTMTLHFGQQVMLGTTSVFLMQSPHCQPIQEYWELARAGRGADASRKYYELEPLREVWQTMYRVLRDKQAATHPLPQIKYWMDLVGMAAGPVRPPMHPLTEEQKAGLKSRIESSGWMDRLYPRVKEA